MTPVQHKGMPRWSKWLIYLSIVGVVAALIWSQLPRGPYPTDLTRIGEGRPALVLAYDINSMGGAAVMGLMDALRGEYADRIEFLVAPIGAPHGHDFAERHGAVNGTVVLFSGDGSHVRTIHLPQTTEELRRALEQVLAISLRIQNDTTDLARK